MCLTSTCVLQSAAPGPVHIHGQSVGAHGAGDTGAHAEPSLRTCLCACSARSCLFPGPSALPDWLLPI